MPSRLLFDFLAILLSTSLASSDPTPEAWNLLLKRCPSICTSTAPGQWSAYHSVDRVRFCNQTMLLDFSVSNLLSDSTHTTIFACSTSPDSLIANRSTLNATDHSFSEEEANLQLSLEGPAVSTNLSDVHDTLNQMKELLLASENDVGKSLFGYSPNALVGLYAGDGVQHSDVATNAMTKLAEYVESGPKVQMALQHCDTDPSRVFGIVIDTTKNFSTVQQVVQDWNNATCASEGDSTKVIPGYVLRLKKNPSRSVVHRHQRRDDCRTIQVVSGDSCGSLVNKCGISPADFTTYNPSPTLCSSLQIGQHVCCSSGNIPDFSPKPNPDGTCATYQVQAGDWCAKIAAFNSITVDNLEEYNKQTWGWLGCSNLQAQQNICLSTGYPPMPAAIQNAVCGPQVPGTTRPRDIGTLAELNLCPLMACCDIWGQCGITPDFCTPSNSSTGAPGTAAPGSNGCISSCGNEITNNHQPPSEFISVGYFESWGQKRGCLDMDVTSFDSAAYTHLHFAFATLTHDFQVDVSSVQDQFDKLKSMGSVRRILSFGGWSFSTEQDSFPIFRQGVSDANRELFASNVARFIEINGLDGVDFDWEYPGAPDIPGVPPGDPGDGDRYLAFLKLVRQKLSPEKSLSIAAPASFWYLKGFPINKISDVVDYIVFMTYDLHGQWDYGNRWSDPGCPSGACLRSHVNISETTTALVMITKAGVFTKKIIVGLTSYGRSFGMTTAGCTGPMCEFTGPGSGATPGKCTKTAGYIAKAEIDDIIANNPSAQKIFDGPSDSNILVYDSTQWVAYMDETTRDTRTSFYKWLNMGGTVDWAVDLQSFANSASGGQSFANEPIVSIDPSVWNDPSPSMNCPGPCVLVLPDWPLPSGTVISRPPYVTTLDVAWSTLMEVTGSNGVVSTTATVTRIMQETTIIAPPVTTSSLPLANINLTIPLGSNVTVTFRPRPSLPFQIVTITDDPNPLQERSVTHPPVTRTVTLPPWPQSAPIYVPTKRGKPGDNGGGDDGPKFPKVPAATVKPGPGGPPCLINCGSLCRGRFCWSTGGGLNIDLGFADPIDPNPPPNPNDPNGDEDEGKSRSSSSCSEKSTVTDYWVSCASEGSSSSCTTTSSMVAIGCHVTATTTTTGIRACASVDLDEDQGEDGTHPPLPTTTPPTTTTPPSPPEPTIWPTILPPIWKPYCYREHNEQGHYLPFGISEFRKIQKDFCTFYMPGMWLTLDSGLTVEVWSSPDQTGCTASGQLSFSDYCPDILLEILERCDAPIAYPEYFGGGLTWHGPHGCMIFWLAKPAPGIEPPI